LLRISKAKAEKDKRELLRTGKAFQYMGALSDQTPSSSLFGAIVPDIEVRVSANQ
jgi:hypothetical protein